MVLGQIELKYNLSVPVLEYDNHHRFLDEIVKAKNKEEIILVLYKTVAYMSKNNLIERPLFEFNA